MNAYPKPWLPLLAALIVVVGIPVAERLARQSADSGCAQDGTPIDPIYRVKVVNVAGRSHIFCCLSCAQLWLDREATPPQRVLVTDEASGEELDARQACYVRSTVVTTPSTQNRIHVFRHLSDAEKHAAEVGGTVLSGLDRPLSHASIGLPGLGPNIPITP